MPDSAHTPQIEGWHAEPSSDGKTWTARRRSSLSPAQLEYGCRLTIGACSLAELRIQALAEDIKAGVVDMAETLVRDMADAEARRADDCR